MSRQTADIIQARLLGMLVDLAPDVGERLPSERVLARMLGCSRATLRKALDMLEKDGALWRHVGQGTFRGRRPRHLPIRDTVMVQSETPAELIRARRLVEPQVAAEAARCAVPADVAYLRAIVAAGRVARDRSACEETDAAFHRAVAGVSRNPVLFSFLIYLSGARRRTLWQREWDRIYRRVGIDEFRTVHSNQHDRIVDAIAAGDAEAAAGEMETHLETIEAAILTETD